MKKQYLILLVFILFCKLVPAQYSWQQRTNYGGIARCGSVGFSIGNYGYIGGGYTGINLSDFWQYDPVANSWTQKSSLPTVLRFASSFVINDSGYVVGGITNAVPFNDSLYMYNPSANTWVTKAAFPGVARYGAAGFAIGNKGYFGIGNSGSRFGPYYTDFYEYDATTDAWTQKATFPGTTRYGVYGISLNGEGYVGFGGNENLAVEFNDWWQYDPSTDVWTTKPNYPGTIRAYPTGFVINNLIYIGTGIDGITSVATNDFYEYNPTSSTWLQKQNYTPGDRWLVSGFAIGNIGFFGTGADAGNYAGYSEFWEYAPTSLPVASFQSSDSTICTYSCINFTDHSTNATSWLWSFPGGTPSSSSDENPQNICYFVSGSYNVSLIVSNANGSDTLNITSCVTVYSSPPTPVITQVGDTLSFTPIPSDTSYQWFYYNSPIPGETDTSLVAYYNGNYNVKVTNTYGCSVAVGITIVLGVNELESNPYFNLYPNPVSDDLTISISKPFHKTAITVADVFGRKLLDKIFDLSVNNELILNFEGYSAGTYFVTVNLEGNSFTRKVLKLN